MVLNFSLSEIQLSLEFYFVLLTVFKFSYIHYFIQFSYYQGFLNLKLDYKNSDETLAPCWRDSVPYIPADTARDIAICSQSQFSDCPVILLLR